MKVEVGVMGLQAKELKELLAVPEAVKKAWNRFSFGDLRRN